MKDRFALVDEKNRDKTNCHIVLIAKDEIGRRQITRALTEANDTGYYYRPRFDIGMLLALDPAHVIVTTACVAFWGYGFPETEQIILKLWRRFGASFYLEVQAHQMDEQVRINRFIMSLYRKYGMQLIAACDSHYIYPEQDEDRRNLQLSTKNDEEDDLDSVGQNDEALTGDTIYMDYPDGDELFRRFKEQGVLPDAVIDEAIRNTLIMRTLADFEFDKSKKVPNPYPSMTREERNAKYLALVNDSWNKYKVGIPESDWPRYEAEIKYETDTIVDTDFADYFLLDYEIVRRGVAKGGTITKSGRGSAASYITNSLLGFSSMDRLALPIKLFPDRFVSRPRLMAGKLPDLDLNVAEREPFIEAQKELLGADHAFPMIAYGSLRRKSAWKMYARAKKVDPALANKISDQLGRFDLAVKHAEEDEEIDLTEYVDEQYLDLVKESDPYTGIIAGKTIHPCAILIYSGDIKSEIGLVRAKSKTGKIDELVTVIDGATAEKFGFIKNDILRVTVWELIENVYRNIGIEIPDTMELMRMTARDKATWNIFAQGHTIGVNQCERQKTREKAMRYKPKNITELSAFVAAVRPAFQSNIEAFLTRQPFSYKIPAFDSIIQTEFMKSSFLLYQENIMAALGFAGFDKTECYVQLQNIAKKHPEEIAKIRPRFIDGFSSKVEGSPEKAQETSERVWQIISDASGYGFCAAHATAVAFDALYIAYAKAHYPLETYRTMLEIYSKRGDKDRLAAIKNEMANAFKIHVKPVEFGDDNTGFSADAKDNAIRDALHSLPYMNRQVARELAELGKTDYDSWVDLLVDLAENTSLNARQIDILIKLNYFKRFGDVNKLLELYSEFRNGDFRYSAKHKDATKQKRLAKLHEMEANWTGKTCSPFELARYQVEITGSLVGVFDADPNCYVITDLDTKYSARITLYSLKRGTSGMMKMRKANFQSLYASKGDTIRILKWETRPQYRYVDGKSRPVPGTEEKWILDACVVEKNNDDKLSKVG